MVKVIHVVALLDALYKQGDSLGVSVSSPITSPNPDGV